MSSFLELRWLAFALPQYLACICAEKEYLPSSRLATVAEDMAVEASHCSYAVFTLHILHIHITFY